MNMRHLENYWKLGKQIGVHYVLVFDVIRGKLSSIVLLVCDECHLSYSLLSMCQLLIVGEHVLYMRLSMGHSM